MLLDEQGRAGGQPVCAAVMSQSCAVSTPLPLVHVVAAAQTRLARAATDLLASEALEPPKVRDARVETEDIDRLGEAIERTARARTRRRGVGASLVLAAAVVLGLVGARALHD